jgi:prepilin-type N-terminal cleavage/methylation domain-containing protein
MRPSARIVAKQDGFTLIETLVAMVILVTGLLATFTALNSSSHLTLTTQREQVAMTVAEQQMEQLRAISYSSIEMSSTPSHTSDGNATGDNSGNPTNPNYWVNSSGSNLLIPTNFNKETSGTLSGVSSLGEPFVTGGTITPTTTVSSGGYTATVYRYVTWMDDGCVTTALCTLWSATQDALHSETGKRITIAVLLSSGGNGVSKPVWLTTDVADPQAGL